MRIGVLAVAADTQANELAARIALASGRPCPVFEYPLRAGTAVALDGDHLSWGGEDLGSFDKMVLAGFDVQDPLVPRAVPSTDWRLWQIDYIVDQQGASFLASVWRDLERRGVRLVNSWHALQFGFAKPRLLAELQRAGLRVPPWLCSNEMPVVQRFCAEQKSVVWRPATGRAMVQLFLDKQRLALVDPALPPVLLAAHPGRTLRRAFVCGDEVLLAVDTSVARVDGWERMEEVWTVDAGPVARELVRALRRIRADWAEIAFVEQDGRPCIYDVDPDPRYGWLPADFRAYLQARLARKLLDLPAPAAGKMPAPERGERESLFLRRMLAVLHDMEATKYTQDP